MSTKQTSEDVKFSTIEEALEDLKAGKFIVIVDDEDRENEGDLVMAAEFVEPSHIDFYEREARGWICVPMTADECERLHLPLMVDQNTSLHRTPFTVTIDYLHNTTTGISAGDQAKTIRALSDNFSRAEDFARPGHVRPLRAARGGVLSRTGHTEAVVDLMRIAGLHPAGVLCEIKKAGGEMARLPDLDKYCKKNGFKLITIADLIKYRLRTEKLVEQLVEADLPTPHGVFRAIAYGVSIRDETHLALVLGDITGEEPVLVRVNSECVLGDVFGTLLCDCSEQMDQSLDMIADEGKGVVLYLRHARAGWETVEWLRYLTTHQQGLDTSNTPAIDQRKIKHEDYGTGAQILRDLGLNKIRLISDSTFKMVGLGAYGIEIVERVSLDLKSCDETLQCRRKYGDLEKHLDH